MRLLAGVLHSDEIVWNSYTWDADAHKQINTKRLKIKVFSIKETKNLTVGTTGYWGTSLNIPDTYKILYASYYFNNADLCQLTPYSTFLDCIGKNGVLGFVVGYQATSTASGTLCIYAVCIEI